MEFQIENDQSPLFKLKENRRSQGKKMRVLREFRYFFSKKKKIGDKNGDKKAIIS